MVSLSTVSIVISSITIVILLYVVFSKKGWNCTENGCAYVTGGTFDTYDQCNSICKSKQVQSQAQSQVQSQVQSRSSSSQSDNNQVQSRDNQSDNNQVQSKYNQSDNNQMVCNKLNSGQNCQYSPTPYYSYLPGPFYHDNYWYRHNNHHNNNHHNDNHHKDSGGNRIHNENHIFVNSPTGPNI